VATGDRPQPAAQLVLLSRAGPVLLALGGAMLADHRTRPTLGHPEALLQNHYGPAPALRGQKFPVIMLVVLPDVV
jgi:hypothetical protein